MSSRRPPPGLSEPFMGRTGDDERDFDHVLAIVRRFGFSFGHLQNQIIVELWRLVCSAPSVPSVSQVGLPLLPRDSGQIINAPFGCFQVRFLVAICSERTSDFQTAVGEESAQRPQRQVLATFSLPWVCSCLIGIS